MKNIKLLNDLEGYITKFRVDDVRCNVQLKTKIDDTSVLTYGSTPYETFFNLINDVNLKPKRFIVVGCSIGWMNFYWNELHPNIETIGIDIHSYRIGYGNKLIKDYNLDNIELKDFSFYDFEFQEGDLIWQSNLCFPQEEIYKSNDKIIEKTPNISIISYKPISQKEESKTFIKKYYYPVSWMDKQPFHIYEKL